MSVVFIYPGSGKFAGGETEWNSPELGSFHKFMLFLAQEQDSPAPDIARVEIERFGFKAAEIGGGKRIDVEALNDPTMAAFQKHYEGALSEGCSIVWYP